MASCATVIFDLDGVLADTIPYLYQTYLGIVSKHGGKGSPSEFDQLNGKTLEEICEHLLAAHELGCPIETLRADFRSAFESIYENVGLVEGTVAMLEELSESGVSLGLATAAPRHLALGFLERQGVVDYFAEIVTGDDVARAKPDPEIFLRAMTKLPDLPHYVLEDSLNGLEAAVAAGAVAIHFARDSHFPTPDGIRAIEALSEFNGTLFAADAELVAASGDIQLVDAAAEMEEVTMEQAAQVAQCWEVAREKNPSLFNGEIIQYHSHEVCADGRLMIRCQVNEYKRLLAQMTVPLDLGIRPLAVSGIVVDASGAVLVGRRGSGVTEYPGAYELVPSGGLTPEHASGRGFIDQWTAELREECGISSSEIGGISPIGLCHDHAHGVDDIALACVLKRAFRDEDFHANAEYSQLLPVDGPDLPEFLASHVFTPTARLIGSLYLGLPRTRVG